ncbi:MAG TPA: type II toxin-antitoxin system VapC family toxin [Candidatus Nanoarchaeia archaeon]|nr:type II toxin-antitoxin system VapC family toxin [Candidatus Nanoarchaeia archaeon]
METRKIFDTNVAFEKQEGLITIFTVIEYPPASNKNFEILFPEAMDYTTALKITETLRKKGKPLGAIDILIAAMSMNRSLTVTTKDKDFLLIKEALPEFKVEII